MATVKQKTALALMVENGGNASKAMRDAGYSPATAENPQKLTTPQGFQELMQQMGVTDEKLVGVLKAGLEQEDHSIRHKYLETSLKIKGIGRDAAPMSFSFVNVVGNQAQQYDL